MCYVNKLLQYNINKNKIYKQLKLSNKLTLSTTIAVSIKILYLI